MCITLTRFPKNWNANAFVGSQDTLHQQLPRGVMWNLWIIVFFRIVIKSVICQISDKCTYCYTSLRKFKCAGVISYVTFSLTFSHPLKSSEKQLFFQTRRKKSLFYAELKNLVVSFLKVNYFYFIATVYVEQILLQLNCYIVLYTLKYLLVILLRLIKYFYYIKF